MKREPCPSLISASSISLLSSPSRGSFIPRQRAAAFRSCFSLSASTPVALTNKREYEQRNAFHFFRASDRQSCSSRKREKVFGATLPPGESARGTSEKSPHHFPPPARTGGATSDRVGHRRSWRVVCRQLKLVFMMSARGKGSSEAALR